MAPAKNVSLMALSLLSFALADVRDGLGPFLGVYLQGKGWMPDEIGYVMTAGGVAGMLFTTPLGALTDSTRHKRFAMAVATVLIVLSVMAVFLCQSFVLVAGMQVVQGIMAAAIAPLLTSISLGVVGQKGLAHRLGQNEAWNHFGNFSTAALGGLVGYFYGIPGVFAVMLALFLLLVVLIAAQIMGGIVRPIERLRQVTGAGCMTSSLCAAFASVCGAFAGTAAGIAFMDVCGEIAAERSNGLGGFHAALFDAAGSVTPEILMERLDMHEC